MIPLLKPGGRIVPGVSRAAKVADSPVSPDEVDVVVVGGGIVGACTALELAERGVGVLLCEKGVIAGEASGRAFGWIDSQFLDPAKMELIARSKQLWESMNERVGAETGYRKRGLLSLLPTEDDVAFAQGWLDSVKGAPGVDARIVSGGELDDRLPPSEQNWTGALFQPSDACVEPTLAASAIVEAAKAKGAFVHQNCAVRGFEFEGGTISGVVTEKGAISCKSVVIAAATWSPLLAGSVGIKLPQFQAHASMMRIAPFDGPETSAWGPGYTWRRNLDGSYTLGAINGAVPITPATIKNAFRLIPALRAMWDQVEPVFSLATFMDHLTTPSKWPMDRESPFERNRVIQPEFRHKVLDEVVKAVSRDFPSFEGHEDVERWAGVLTTTLDNTPIISQADSHPGLFLGTGFYYGLTMGPAAGEALADLVVGNDTKIDLGNYRHSRFSDGTKLVFRQ